jgi:hypothetical protein
MKHYLILLILSSTLNLSAGTCFCKPKLKEQSGLDQLLMQMVDIYGGSEGKDKQRVPLFVTVKKITATREIVYEVIYNPELTQANFAYNSHLKKILESLRRKQR